MDWPAHLYKGPAAAQCSGQCTRLRAGCQVAKCETLSLQESCSFAQHIRPCSNSQICDIAAAVSKAAHHSLINFAADYQPHKSRTLLNRLWRLRGSRCGGAHCGGIADSWAGFSPQSRYSQPVWQQKVVIRKLFAHKSSKCFCAHTICKVQS